MRPRIAVIHDWLVTYAGAEKVLEQILQVYPQADLFALCDFLPDDQRDFIGDRSVRTTFIQNLPLAKKRYRSYLPLMPLAIEQLDVSSYDIVISSSHAVAKGILTGPDQLHVSYVHSPIRYAWDMQHQYLRESRLEHGLKSLVARWILHKIRLWDVRTASGVNEFLCNSRFIARRIDKAYGRSSKVIYPPVDTGRFALVSNKSDFYLTASRLVPYKRVDLIVDAFNRMPSRKLIVVGDGPDLAKIKGRAADNVTVVGYLPNQELDLLMGQARAFIFAAEEDFGIIPVEAQACGTPVIAYGKGGALETVVASGSQSTGLFFYEQSTDALCAAVEEFEQRSEEFTPAACRANSERFSAERFRDELRQTIDESFAAKLALNMPSK